jgi:hypothetical protein
MRYPLASFFLRADVARRSKAAHIARSSPHQGVGIHHAKRFDVDAILYQHCVKKLLVGYLREIALSSDGELYARFAETTTGWPLAQCERTAPPASDPPPSSDVPPVQIPIAAPPPEAPPAPPMPDPGGTQACPQCGQPLRLVVGGKGVYCANDTCRYRALVSS